MKHNPDKFLSFAEVAELIGISEDSLRHYECGTNTLARIKLGRRTVFSFNDVQDWMARKLRETQEAQAQSQMAKQDLLDKQAQRLRDKQWTKKTYLEIVRGLKR